MADGTVECWGLSGFGQTGTLPPASNCNCVITPVAVGGLSGVVAISSGDEHTCALLSHGTVECWGYDDYGQLGVEEKPMCIPNLSTPCSTVPLAVEGVQGATAIAAHGIQSCALVGGIWKCWGNYDASATPPTGSLGAVALPGLTNVATVTSGGDLPLYSFSCAVLLDGTVDCWGTNAAGQLGNGTVADSTVPVRVLF
jgi:alpha-tubulin suppressor-like RCC1 family protein